MLWNQWWFWLFVVILASLSIPILGVLGWAMTNIVRALRGSPKELKQLKEELSDLRSQLVEARAAQKLLEAQRQLSQQELKKIEQQTLPQGVAVILFSDITGLPRTLTITGTRPLMACCNSTTGSSARVFNVMAVSRSSHWATAS